MLIRELRKEPDEIDTVIINEECIKENDEIDINFIIETLIISVLTEEIALRRSLINTIKKYSDQWKNYIYPLSGLWFGLIHLINLGTFKFSYFYVLFQVIFGIIDGYFFAKFSEELGIIISIFIHLLNNLFALSNPLELNSPMILYCSIKLVNSLSSR